MSVPDRHGASKCDNGGSETILVLTDGSDRADRVAEWGLIFADASWATVRWIEVVECLDSGVIIQDYEDCVQNERGDPRRRFERESTGETTQSREHTPATDVLHGEPHEALLDYVAANAIGLCIIGVCERTRLHRSFVGSTLARVNQAATVPVVLIGGTEKHSKTQYSMPGTRDCCADRS